jgi:hypothetical protein
MTFLPIILGRHSAQVVLAKDITQGILASSMWDKNLVLHASNDAQEAPSEPQEFKHPQADNQPSQ